VDALLLSLVASGTALATSLGAVPVFMLGSRANALQPLLTGVAIGVMAVASVAGLLLPAFDEGSAGAVLAGLALGIAFLLVARRAIGAREVHVGQLAGGNVRTAVLVFLVLLVHSLPEGFAIGR
jgi:ZIP family zinc transporter